MTTKAIAARLCAAMILPATWACAGQVKGLGVGIGATASHMYSTDGAYGKSASAAGLIVGPFLDVSISRSVVFRPAIVFVRRGGTYRDLPSSLTGTLGEVHELSIRRDYLELPLLLRYSFLREWTLSPSLIAGPTIGRVLSYKVVEDGWDLGAPVTDDPNPIPKESGGYDTALVLGVGLNHVHGGTRFNLDAVYRMASRGPRSDAPASGFEADGLDVTFGVRF